MGSIGTVTVDSGTSLAYFPKSVVNSIVNEIGNCQLSSTTGYYTCSCKGTSSIKSIWVNFNGTAVEMQSNYWVAYDSSKSLCYLQIQSYGSGTACLLGDSFMRGKYIVHDIAGKQMAFGNT